MVIKNHIGIYLQKIAEYPCTEERAGRRERFWWKNAQNLNRKRRRTAIKQRPKLFSSPKLGYESIYVRSVLFHPKILILSSLLSPSFSLANFHLFNVFVPVIQNSECSFLGCDRICLDSDNRSIRKKLRIEFSISVNFCSSIWEFEFNQQDFRKKLVIFRHKFQCWSEANHGVQHSGSEFLKSYSGKMARESGGVGAGDDPGTSSPKNKVKVFCSHGGKILPRTGDGMLKYVGGQSRVIGVPRDITLSGIHGSSMFVSLENLLVRNHSRLCPQLIFIT